MAWSASFKGLFIPRGGGKSVTAAIADTTATASYTVTQQRPGEKRIRCPPARTCTAARREAHQVSSRGRGQCGSGDLIGWGQAPSRGHGRAAGRGSHLWMPRHIASVRPHEDSGGVRHGRVRSVSRFVAQNITTLYYYGCRAALRLTPVTDSSSRLLASGRESRFMASQAPPRQGVCLLPSPVKEQGLMDRSHHASACARSSLHTRKRVTEMQLGAISAYPHRRSARLPPPILRWR